MVGVAKFLGLKTVRVGGWVEFERGERGMALTLKESSVGIFTLEKPGVITKGALVKRQKNFYVCQLATH